MTEAIWIWLIVSLTIVVVAAIIAFVSLRTPASLHSINKRLDDHGAAIDVHNRIIGDLVQKAGLK